MAREDDSPDLTDAETMTNGDRIVELKSELVKQYARVSDAEKRAAAAELASGLADPEELPHMRLQALAAFEEKEIASRALHEVNREAAEAKREAAEAREKMRQSHERLENIRNVNKGLSDAFEEVRSAKPHEDSATITQLRATMTERDVKIEQQADKNDQLNAQYSSLLENLKKFKADASKNSDETVSYKFKNENIEFELNDLHARLARSERNHGRLQKDHVRILTEHANASRNTRLEVEDTKPTDKFNDVRTYMAWHITELDLSKGGIRTFNCNHENFCDIPDGQNSTREMTVSRIADELFQEWMEDKKFVKEYNDARPTSLNHHRAHEKAGQGRGVASWFMKKELTAIDQKRGVPVKY